MRSHIYSICLSAFLTLTFVVAAGAAEEQPDPVPANEVQTLQIEGLVLKGEEIDYQIRRGGQHGIRLQGQAGIRIDQMEFLADFIHAVYSKKENAMIELKGQVRIVSPEDQLRAKCLEARFNLTERSLTLKGNAEESAQLLRYAGNRVTQVEAAEIQIQFSDQETVLIKSSGPVEISERQQTPADDFPVLQNAQNSGASEGFQEIPTFTIPTLDSAPMLPPVRSDSFSVPKTQYLGNYPFTK